MTPISELPPHAAGAESRPVRRQFRSRARRPSRKRASSPCGGSGSIASGGWSAPAIRSRIRTPCPPLATRIAAAKKLAPDPRIVVTGFEAAIGARYTYQTILYLKTRCPGVPFRLDHGRRQSRELRALETLAHHRRQSCRSRSSTGPARRFRRRIRRRRRARRAIAMTKATAWSFRSQSRPR